MGHKSQIERRRWLLAIDSPVRVVESIGENGDGWFAVQRLLASALPGRVRKPVGTGRPQYGGHVCLHDSVAKRQE